MYRIAVIVITILYTGELGYNDICIYDTSSIASDILCYQLIPHC
jgi:hypothetical protein